MVTEYDMKKSRFSQFTLYLLYETTLLPKATRNSNKPSPNVIIQRIYQVASQSKNNLGPIG